ncbi:MAG TPA: glycosyltransferase family 39 protein [Patescibacteria group bacterium]|nr:glycosyltransferase family 39 protein [Patescibacteria group bacterium]
MSAENTIHPGTPQAEQARAVASERRRTRTVLLIAFLVALIVRGVAGWYAGSAQPQEIRYITIARGLMAGNGFHGLDNRYPDIIQPPLFPMMLAVALVLPGPDLAIARGVSILMGALLVFPCAVIARRLFGEKTTRRVACLVAVYPLLADISAAAITESTFALLVMLAALSVWRALDTGDSGGGPLPSVTAGLLLGLAFLTRPEGLAYLAAAWAACAVDALLSRSLVRTALAHLRKVLFILAGFAVVVAPYLVWVHARIGHWMMAPKATLVHVHQTLSQEGQREGWNEPYGSLIFWEHVKFGLNEQSTAIRAHEGFSGASAGITEGLLVSDDDAVTILSPMMAVRTGVRNFGELYLETIKYGFVIPSLLVMMLGIGLVSRPWVGPFRRAAMIVLVFLGGSFTFLVSHVEPRFLYAAIPFLLPWMGEGWRRSEAWAIGTFSGDGGRTRTRERLVRAGVGTVVLVLTLLHLPPALRITSNLWSEHRELGQWLLKEVGPDRKVMAATPVVAYYAAARYEVMPYADLDSLLDYARSKGVEYLVADRAEIPSFRPQLTSLLIPERPHPGLEVIRALHEGTPHAIFLYSVLPVGQSAR